MRAGETGVQTEANRQRNKMALTTRYREATRGVVAEDLLQRPSLQKPSSSPVTPLRTDSSTRTLNPLVLATRAGHPKLRPPENTQFSAIALEETFPYRLDIRVVSLFIRIYSELTLFRSIM